MQIIGPVKRLTWVTLTRLLKPFTQNCGGMLLDLVPFTGPTAILWMSIPISHQEDNLEIAAILSHFTIHFGEQVGLVRHLIRGKYPLLSQVCNRPGGKCLLGAV